MKWIFYIIAFLLPSLAFSQARSWTTGTYGNGAQQAYFYKPPGYDGRADWPVVIFLHGQGEMGATVSTILGTGLPQQINGGMDLPAVVICPQLQAGAPAGWTAAIVQLAYNHVMTNYNVDYNQVYVTGLSLGASGCGVFARAYPYKVAAIFPISGSNYITGSKVENDSSAKVPLYMLHGTGDGTQGVNNSYAAFDTFAVNRTPSVFPELELIWGGTHSQTVWDVAGYEKFDTKFLPWLLLHHKNADSTALFYVDSTENTTGTDKWDMYWKSVRLVNSLSASSHKTALLTRLADVYNQVYGTGNKRVILDMAVSGKSPTTNINNLTASTTGSTYPNLLTETGANSGWTFAVITAAGSPDVTEGKNSSIFGNLPGGIFTDSWYVWSNPNSSLYRLSGLDNSKQYTIRLTGATTVLSPSYETGIILTIGSVSDTARHLYHNTRKYAEITNVSPSGGIINMNFKAILTSVKGYVSFIEVVEQGTQESGGNTLPVVNAGNDQTIRLPVNSVTISGSATDPDGTISSVLWEKLSGPTANIVSPTIATTIVNGLVEGTYVFRLTATDNLGGINSDNIAIIVQPAYHIPPTVTSNSVTVSIPTAALIANYTTPSAGLAEIRWTKFKAPSQTLKRITVVGSSTAQGYGLVVDSSFVGRLKNYYKAKGIIDTIYNRGVSATDIFGLNITSALNYGAGVLLVNFPSNGYSGGTYTVTQICQEYQKIADSCANRGVQFYTTGTQPREDFSSGDRIKLNTINDSLRLRFGNRFIDFMSIVKDSIDNQIKGEYTQGDGLHINSLGHERFMQAVIARGLFQNIVASASISIIESPTQSSTNISALTDGDHEFLVSVLDSSGFAANKIDTVTVNLTQQPCNGIRRVITLGGPGSYNSVDLSIANPGDTIIINATTTGYLEFKNGNGTEQCPIVIMNQGGQVISENLNFLFPQQHIILNGRGHAGTPYGFRAANSSYFGMGLQLQGPFEAFNVEIHNTAMGIQLKHSDNPPAELKASGHNGFKLHNMYIHNVDNEGMYLGSSSAFIYNDHPKVIGLHVYDILIDSTSREGFQSSNAQDALIERVKIIDPSYSNSPSQNHAFNLGDDFQGTVKNIYIQSSPSYNMFLSGGRTIVECVTMEHIDRGFPVTLAIFGKNDQFNTSWWNEPYQQLTFKNIHIIDGGGVSIISTTTEGALQPNLVENVKVTGGVQPPAFVWGPGDVPPTLINIAAGATLTCTPPTSTTMWTADWPVTSPPLNERRLIKREY